jgi:dihydropteroate synthase
MNRLICNGHALDLSIPAVMGILNLTPDSFFDGGQYETPAKQLFRVAQMVSDGASLIDMGAVSTRPGAADVTENEELMRLLPPLDRIVKEFPHLIVSVDTFRPAVARAAVEHGAGIINDVYGGRFHPDMISTVASLKVPYILMHMKGMPGNMQVAPEYNDVVAEVYYFFENQLKHCREKGLTQVIVDPGFGFGKTVEHNFELLSHLDRFKSLDVPLLAGLSRKSMINKVLNTAPDQALNGTTVLNTIALLKGANIIRVHDVKAAVDAVKLVGLTFPESRF